MRVTLFLAVLLAPLAARAEGLSVDTALWSQSAALLAEHQDAAAALPATLDLAAAMAGAQSSSSGRSTSSGGGALSGFGIGLQLGSPTAVTVKFAGQGNTNIVLGVGAGIGYRGNFFGLHLHGDYLFTVATLVNNADLNLSAYIGPGLFIALFNANSYGFGFGYYYGGNYGLFGFGGRLPLGLNLRFAAAPIEVYLELDPMLLVFPGIDFNIGASLGFRWFF